MAYISFQPSDFFSPKLYTGTGSSNAVTGVGFQPDMVWIKSRSDATDHVLYDAVRGAEQVMYPNTSDADAAASTGLTAFGADGFTVVSEGNVNGSSRTFASWNWKGGTTSGIATNGSTTITPSAYSFNQTSGFSVIKYSGNNTSGAKVAHGLGAVPEMIIVKTTNTANDWNIYHKGVDIVVPISAPEDYYMTFTSGARTNDSSRWNDTAPDAVNFTLGNAAAVNGSSNTMVAYCFAEKKGYSKFGRYQGSGSVSCSPFIYTGFRPAFIIVKRVDSTGNWFMWDDKRLGYNPNNNYLMPSTTGAESSATNIDILSNGFKFRSTDADLNGTSADYIYTALAASPLVSSNDVPTVAR